jgi:hypothetical protein
MSISAKQLEEAQKPLSPDEVEWRVNFEGQNAKAGSTRIVPYINARCASKRLMSLGMGNYQVTYIPYNLVYDDTKYDKNAGKKVTTTNNAVAMTCTIKLKFEDEWCSYENGSDQGQISPIKSLYSDSCKRACTAIGIGVDLYDYPVIYISESVTEIPKWAWSQLNQLTEDFCKGLVNSTTTKYLFLKDGVALEYGEPREVRYISVANDVHYVTAVKEIEEGLIKTEVELLKAFTFSSVNKDAIQISKMNKAKVALIALLPK